MKKTSWGSFKLLVFVTSYCSPWPVGERVSRRYHLRRLVSKTFPYGWNCDNHDRTNGSDYARVEDDRVFVCLSLEIAVC